MAIHLIHGCTSEWQSGRQVFRNYVPEASLRTHLRTLTTKYGDWPASAEHNVLTIDDATEGAGRAARIAREYGHRVSLFVNPHQLGEQLPYYFSHLNRYLDNRRISQVTYLGIHYDLTRDIRAFRAAVKGVLSRLAPDEALSRVHELGERLGSPPGPLDDHARTLSIADLIELSDLGVSIENHGWGHQRIDAMTIDAFKADVSRSARWLRDVIGVDSKLYAVPFGETDRHEAALEQLSSAVLLADVRLPPGLVGKNRWNRLDITGRLQQLHQPPSAAE
jgi:peptidoglycan/xylan/chitin deacetylase (PgdA/CDA1 family)